MEEVKKFNEKGVPTSAIAAVGLVWTQEAIRSHCFRQQTGRCDLPRPCDILNAKAADNHPLVSGKKVTGFTKSEEAAVELTQVVPFLLEDEPIAKGGLFSRSDDWVSYVVEDGLLITGQNPASSEKVAKRLLARL